MKEELKEKLSTIMQVVVLAIISVFIAILIAMLLNPSFAKASTEMETTTTKATVLSVKGDTVAFNCEDGKYKGDIFTMTDSPKYWRVVKKAGVKVKINFNTCGTKSILDDRIVSVKPPKNVSLVARYISNHYKGKRVKFVEIGDLTITDLQKRKENNIVYVEIMRSVSQGTYGYTNEGYYIRYNKKVPKGKSVVSYCIYNPNSVYTDDVVAVIDNGILR